MAKSKVNKSNLIREHLQANPDAKVKDVVAALASNGHKVTPNLVYYIKGKTAGRKQRKKRVIKAAKAATSKTSGNAATGKADAITLIRDVRALAERAGGYRNLKELVDALEG